MGHSSAGTITRVGAGGFKMRDHRTGRAIAPHDVDIWLTALDPDGRADPGAFAVLSPDEQAHASRLRQDRDRELQVQTRVALRRILGRHLGVDPAAVAIGAGPDGKPEVTGPGRPRRPCFNVAHSGAIGLIAVSESREVGVDAEQLRDAPWREVAERYFAPAEVAALVGLPAGRQRGAFFDCWVRKEAYVKGLGVGLRRPTSTFMVPLGDVGGPVDDPEADAQGSPCWMVHPLDLGPDYAAALAVADGEARLIMRGACSAGPD